MVSSARIHSRSSLKIGRRNALRLAAATSTALLLCAPSAAAEASPIAIEALQTTVSPPVATSPWSSAATCSTAPLFHDILAAGEGHTVDHTTTATGQRLGCLIGLARANVDPVRQRSPSASGWGSFICEIARPA